MKEVSEKSVKSLKVLNKYQYDLSNLRSHHWKYHIDLYKNCYYDCKYCVYRSGGDMERIEAREDILDDLRDDLKSMDPKGIVYLGPTADVYQPLEKRKKVTRRALEICLETETPTFIITRSDLILRDIDILSKMAQKGLIEISVTIASPNSLKALEPYNLSAEERINIAKTLHEHNIPVSIHLSPIIPYFDTVEEIKGLLNVIEKETKALCTYACMLGMRDAYKEDLILRVSAQDKQKGDLLRELYPSIDNYDVQSAKDNVVYEIMEELSQYCDKENIPFACVHIPPFDTVQREGNIFAHKLPTIGDIVRYYDTTEDKEIRLNDLKNHLKKFPSVDEEYLYMIEKYFNEGILFKNTYYHFDPQSNDICYKRMLEIDLKVTNMAVKS
ncbi:radical SAM protein [Bacillus cereus]|uniref:SPL family radical SAM protein n=1 Tax=Bacillus cereus TaxID=1396 RepID=UPI000BF6C405|nr:radical SAM protein [Bacillus cereus]PFU78103.1 radical SAM protein [Bacillus cereus]